VARTEIRKVMFTYEPDARLVKAVEEALPGVEHIVATTDEERTREIAGTQLTIGPGFGADVLTAADELVWYHLPWAGVEHMPLQALAERGIILTNSRGISAPNMAEHVIAFMLAFGRGLPTFFREQQRHRWRGWDNPPAFFELTNQTVMLLGTGAIGQEIARRLKPFGCRIIGVRRQPGHIEGFDDVVTFEGLGDILAQADHVVSSLPMTSFTAGLVDRTFIDSMKPGSYFHNVGRGGTVDQAALIDALQRGHLAGAGMDVTDPEPLPEDSPLWDTPNTIITGHTSGSSPLASGRAVEVLRENLRRYIAGEELMNVVDLEFGY
jgi:phosphoglycerate dehydrogenase-like enzyme